MAEFPKFIIAIAYVIAKHLKEITGEFCLLFSPEETWVLDRGGRKTKKGSFLLPISDCTEKEAQKAYSAVIAFDPFRALIEEAEPSRVTTFVFLSNDGRVRLINDENDNDFIHCGRSLAAAYQKTDLREPIYLVLDIIPDKITRTCKIWVIGEASNGISLEELVDGLADCRSEDFLPEMNFVYLENALSLCEEWAEQGTIPIQLEKFLRRQQEFTQRKAEEAKKAARKGSLVITERATPRRKPPKPSIPRVPPSPEDPRRRPFAENGKPPEGVLIPDSDEDGTSMEPPPLLKVV